MSQTKANRLKEKVIKVFWITFSWLIISHFLFYYENRVLSNYECDSELYDVTNIYITNLIVTIIAGILGGSCIVILMEKWIRNLPYIRALVYIFISYTLVSLFVTIIGGLFYVSHQLNVSAFNTEVHESVWAFLVEMKFLRSYFVWLFILLGTLIMLMVNDKYGPGVFIDFLLGKYFKPRREERIFMFLDLRSSTTIAEKLGEEKYFSFIKDVFKDATPSILESKGEIYQYVGDEIVISWKMENGQKNANCLRCFFDVQHAFIRKSDYYLEQYGVEPEFKAGLHHGFVMAGEVGIVKRDIAFSGDVLNTAARIQSKCNELNVNILFSKYLLDRLALPPHSFEPRKMGDMLLRGKNQIVVLYTA